MSTRTILDNKIEVDENFRSANLTATEISYGSEVLQVAMVDKDDSWLIRKFQIVVLLFEGADDSE